MLELITSFCHLGLAYCRHLSTVRTHLSALINPTIIERDIPYDAKGGLSAEVWQTFLQDSSVRTQTIDYFIILFPIRPWTEVLHQLLKAQIGISLTGI